MQDLFDPITFGHLDIITRALTFCDKLIIAIGINPNKKSFFEESERKELIAHSINNECFPEIKEKVEIVSFQGLLIEYAKTINASLLIRGIRSVSDFEYEINLANVNKILSPNIETVFLPTSPDLAVVSSSMVKEIAKYNGSIDKFVSKPVVKAINAKYGFIKYGEK